MPESAISAEDLTNSGERMIVDNHWGYWAHLSIYRFALPFAIGKRVLDAGCGSGYGSVYLAQHGANVHAVDAGELAIKHCRTAYADESITFDVADLGKPLKLEDGSFDLVFSSNVFEHVGAIDTLCAEAARVMKPDGVTIVAVPPVCSAESAMSDMENEFHVHHIPPTAWHVKLSRFFEEVTCYAHRPAGRFVDPDVLQRELRLPQEEVTVKDTDFDFPETTAEELSLGETITAIYVCRGRIMEPGPETLAERTPAAWKEGELAAKVIARLKSREAALVNDNWILGEQKKHELLARGTAERDAVRLSAELEARAKEVEDLRARLAQVESANAELRSRADRAEAEAAERSPSKSSARASLLSALGLGKR